MKLADIDIPKLGGGLWINLTEAAELLGYTRSYMYKRASKYGEEGGFKTLHRVGNQASYVITVEEVNEILADREQLSEETRASLERGLEEAARGDTVELDLETLKEKKPRKKRAKTEKVVQDDPSTESEPAAVIQEENEKELSLEEVLAQI